MLKWLVQMRDQIIKMYQLKRGMKIMEEEEEEIKHPRQMLHNFLSICECKELEFIHKSSSCVGYRPNVFSTTLSHLIATNCPHLLVPFVSIRERLKEAVEEFFGCQFELFVEFTGLISWTRGASIGWHSDDNRPYLKQRDFAAVCYLNSYGKDFSGGLFHFQDGKPTTFAPAIGDVLMYTADSRNIHSVDEITDGERLTLTLWFSRDRSHDEDTKLISLLSQCLHNSERVPHSYVPLPASSNMYWFSPLQVSQPQLGFDLRWARLHVLGYSVRFFKRKNCSSDISDFSDLQMEPLGLVRGDELFHKQFANILHALQVVQFYCWKAPKFHTCKVVGAGKITERLSQSEIEEISDLSSILVKDHQLAETVLNYITSNKSTQQQCFTWVGFSAAIAAWDDYTTKLHTELFRCVPVWQTHQSIFNVAFD